MKGGKTLDLAYYESINAIWKEFNLLKRIDKETALEYIEVLSIVFRALEANSIKGKESIFILNIFYKGFF